MDRREFIKYQLQGMLWLAAGGSGLFLPKTGQADATPDIAAVKGDRAAATRAAVELLGGMQRFVKPGNRVVIKPNMSFARPRRPVPTPVPKWCASWLSCAGRPGPPVF